MAISTRGQVFSMIAILMSVLFIAIFSLSTNVPLNKDAPIAQAEITYINEFVASFDRLVKNAVDRTAYYTFSHFALIQQQYFAIADGNASEASFDNFSQSFTSCFYNDTFDYNLDSGLANLSCAFNNSQTTGGQAEIIDFSFSHYFQQTLNKAQFGYSFDSYDFILRNVEFSQGNTPFEFEITVDLSIGIQRASYNWSRDLHISRVVDINGIDHPLLPGRTIRYHPQTVGGASLSSCDGNDSLLAQYIDQGYYFYDPNSTSIIDLFEGRLPGVNESFSNPASGISSILPANHLYNQSVSNYDLHLGTPYEGPQSSTREYDFLAQNSYSSDLYRYGGLQNSISSNQTLPQSYLEALGFQPATSSLWVQIS